MLVLLDNDVPYGLRRLLRRHVCFHAKQLDWATLKNGLLLRSAEARKFDVLVTADQNIFYQQNNSNRQIALVVLSATDWTRIRAHHERIAEAVALAFPGSFLFVDLPPAHRTNS